MAAVAQPWPTLTGAADDRGDDEETPTVRTRPDVTQKGVTMIGDLPTEVLHQALADTPIEDDTLLGLLIIAFRCDNVSVDSGADLGGDDPDAICRALTEGGVLTTDLDLLRQVARRMLVGVLSCREDRSQSGPFAWFAHDSTQTRFSRHRMGPSARVDMISPVTGSIRS
jgi:ParB family chromosome partitioning protein